MTSEAGRLDDEAFAHLIRDAPLVSMDLVIRNAERKILVCLRQNEPAKDYYFVPGGRIRKNETLAAAFARILRSETGYNAEFHEARFIGVYQHLYPTNRFDHESYGTHYVVLAYEVTVPGDVDIRLDAQHAAYRWADERALIAMPDVHEYTKAYFKP